MKAVLIDDAEKARIALRSDLKSHCPQVAIVGEADGVVSGLELIERTKPHLVFLDIRMVDGTGFDLLENLKGFVRSQLHVIFTTAYNEYAIKAFKFSAVDYLLKPIDPDELKQAVDKINLQKEAVPEQNGQLAFLLNALKDLKQTQKRIALSSAEKVQIVDLTDIIRCESDRNYTLFFLSENRKILVTKTLKEYEELLEEYGFLRVHHSHMINLKQLKEFVKTDGGYAVMNDASQVPVSVRKREQLFRVLGV